MIQGAVKPARAGSKKIANGITMEFYEENKSRSRNPFNSPNQGSSSIVSQKIKSVLTKKMSQSQGLIQRTYSTLKRTKSANNIHSVNNNESKPTVNEGKNGLNNSINNGFHISLNAPTGSKTSDSFFMESERVEDLYGRDCLSYNKKCESYEHFDFKPSLDKKSLKIAEGLEPVITRLTKEKSPNCKRFGSSKSMKGSNSFVNLKEIGNCSLNAYIKFLEGHLSTSAGKQLNRTLSSRSLSISKEIYDKGLDLKKKKLGLFEAGKKVESEEYKKYSYRPSISPFSKKLGSPGDKTGRTNVEVKYHQVSFYEKSKNWKIGKESRNLLLKQEIEAKEIKACTFKPQIDQTIPTPDLVFIGKNLKQIHNYILSRRKMLQSQKEEKEYAEKKLNIAVSCTSNLVRKKSTVPKEFPLSESKSRRSLVTANKPNFSHTARSVSEMRKKLCTQLFFEESACPLV